MDGDFYRRTTHQLNKGHGSTKHPSSGLLLPREYNVKACMLSNVPLEERLYCTSSESQIHSLVFGSYGHMAEGMCAVALGSYGRGHLLFFGDVNAEAATAKMLVTVGVLLVGQSSEVRDDGASRQGGRGSNDRRVPSGGKQKAATGKTREKGAGKRGRRRGGEK
jgi:hypothetical protein